MVIRSEDGKVYKIDAPNPLMKHQDFWDKKDYVLHNCAWTPIMIKDKPKKDPPLSVVIQSFEEELKGTEVIPSVPEIIVEPEVFEKYWCLPAIVTEHRDELYNEVRKSIKYLNKIKINLQLVELNNITSTFITDIDIGIGSIIYHDLSWWKVVKVNFQDNLYILDCRISEETPDFGE